MILKKNKKPHTDKIKDKDRYNILGNNPSTSYLETQIERYLKHVTIALNIANQFEVVDTFETEIRIT